MRGGYTRSDGELGAGGGVYAYPMTSSSQRLSRSLFDPTTIETFRFVGRDLDEDGAVSLRYALDDAHEFEERFTISVPARLSAGDRERVDGLLSLLHWVAGVSYYKAAVPPNVACETGDPPPASGDLLEALYSEGLGEFAFVNGLPGLPRPEFPRSSGVAVRIVGRSPRRVLVPVGGGKDSAVAIEVVRASGLESALFSVGNAGPIGGTVAAAGLPRFLATRSIDPRLIELNRSGALNGHVPVTAIVGCAALLTAALNGFDTVALANERSASAGNTMLDGVEVNHQFSKSRRVERLLSAAVAEIEPDVQIFSVLRPASELSIARAFSRLERYHPVFTSCNRIFKLDPALRLTSWCCDCDKCRFVFLILAPFMEPDALARIFGRAMLGDERQYAGFALLAAAGGHKPFECVGETTEVLAAIRLLADDPRWRDQPVVRRLANEVLSRFPSGATDPEPVFALHDDHQVPPELFAQVDALLGP
jgi:UDP-N-acetyl-alpha-D-muramoyl-L-alanyl-L-glutamate epimerase